MTLSNTTFVGRRRELGEPGPALNTQASTPQVHITSVTSSVVMPVGPEWHDFSGSLFRDYSGDKERCIMLFYPVSQYCDILHNQPGGRAWRAHGYWCSPPNGRRPSSPAERANTSRESVMIEWDRMPLMLATIPTPQLSCSV